MELVAFVGRSEFPLSYPAKIGLIFGIKVLDYLVCILIHGKIVNLIGKSLYIWRDVYVDIRLKKIFLKF